MILPRGEGEGCELSSASNAQTANDTPAPYVGKEASLSIMGAPASQGSGFRAGIRVRVRGYETGFWGYGSGFGDMGQGLRIWVSAWGYGSEYGDMDQGLAGIRIRVWGYRSGLGISVRVCGYESGFGDMGQGFGNTGPGLGICVKVWGYGPGFGDIRHGLLGIWVKV